MNIRQSSGPCWSKAFRRKSWRNLFFQKLKMKRRRRKPRSPLKWTGCLQESKSFLVMQEQGCNKHEHSAESLLKFKGKRHVF